MSADIRTRIVETAMKLFYENGYHVTETKEIAIRSDIEEDELATIFESKDELILEAMRLRDSQFCEWFKTEVHQRGSNAVERLLAVFDILGEWYEGPGFHGCMFINATVEFSKLNDPVHLAAATHKQILYDYIHELTEKTGVENAANLAKQLVLLMEGAIVTTQVTGNPSAAQQARKAVEILVAQALAN